MTYTDMNQLADFIGAHHRTFAGHLCGPTQTTRIFDALMRGRDSLRAGRKKGLTGLNFEAELAYYDHNGFQVKPTVITIELDGDGLRYIEQSAEAFGALT